MTWKGGESRDSLKGDQSRDWIGKIGRPPLLLRGLGIRFIQRTREREIERESERESEERERRERDT